MNNKYECYYFEFDYALNFLQNLKNHYLHISYDYELYNSGNP